MSFLRKLTTLLSVLVLAMLPLSAASASAFQNSHPAQTTQTAQTHTTSMTALPSNGVRIVPGSKINLVSSQSRVPISIRNDYGVEVRVFLWAKPVALWLEMPQTTEVTIPANTTINATVPITAIANGNAEVRVYLTSFSGVRIGPTVWMQLQVERDVEPAILVTFSAIVVVLGVIGGRRMLARRRGATS